MSTHSFHQVSMPTMTISWKMNERRFWSRPNFRTKAGRLNCQICSNWWSSSRDCIKRLTVWLQPILMKVIMFRLTWIQWLNKQRSYLSYLENVSVKRKSRSRYWWNFYLSPIEGIKSFQLSMKYCQNSKMTFVSGSKTPLMDCLIQLHSLTMKALSWKL